MIVLYAGLVFSVKRDTKIISIGLYFTISVAMRMSFAVTLFILFQTHHLRFCLVNNRPNIVMVMSDAFAMQLSGGSVHHLLVSMEMLPEILHSVALNLAFLLLFNSMYLLLQKNIGKHAYLPKAGLMEIKVILWNIPFKAITFPWRQDGRLTFNNQVVKLPYIRYLRELGTTFLNAYTNSPICCPSRAAMWSGQFVHRSESWNNFKCLEANSTTWMDLLKDSGYTTKMIGKLDYTSGSHSVSNRVEAWTRDAELLLSQEGRPVIDLVGNMSTVEIQKTDWQNTRKAKQWIIRNSSSDQPFALYLGLNLPHPYKTESLGPTAGGSTFRTSPFWLSKVSSDLIAVPKWLSLSDMHPVDYYSTVTKNCSGVFTKEEIISIRAFYYAMCAETDAMLGEIIASLRETGVLNNTVLIFTADHGELAMEHRQFYKMSMFEGSVHIPLLFMGPGIKSGLQVDQHVSLVDLYPSVLNIADISVPANLSGYSLLPLMSKSKDLLKHQHPDWIFSEYHGCNANASTYMLIIGHWKYITYSDGQQVPPQLFDLSRDPEELHNVIFKFPDVRAHADKVLCSILSYPLVSARVHQYNKNAFTSWRNSLGGNYSQVIANLRWHVDWQKDSVANEKAIDQWLYSFN